MRYLKGHGIVHRIEKKNATQILEEFYVPHGKGILFSSRTSPMHGDILHIYKAAIEAKKRNELEVFVVNVVDVGLLLSPSLEYTNATTAFIRDDGIQKKLATLTHIDGDIMYRGFFDESKTAVEKFVSMWKS